MKLFKHKEKLTDDIHFIDPIRERMQDHLTKEIGEESGMTSYYDGKYVYLLSQGVYSWYDEKKVHSIFLVFTSEDWIKTLEMVGTSIEAWGRYMRKIGEEEEKQNANP